MDQLHLLRFVKCNVSLINNVWSNFRLIHDLLDQSIVDWPNVIWVVVGLQNGIQDGVTHVERGVLLALLQDLAKDSVALLLPENLLKFWAHEDEQLEDFDRMLSDVQIVNLDQTHYYLEAVQFQKFVEQWI